MPFAENAFFFFASIIVGFLVSVVGNWFVTEFLLYKKQLYIARGETRPLNEIRKSWMIALGVIMVILVFYIICMFYTSSLMQINQNHLENSPNITINTFNNYYNISPVTVKNFNSCNCDIIHLLNPNNPKSIEIFNRI